MYAEFCGLAELPFNNTPDPRFFYSTPDHDEALASMIYTVSERKGFMLLTGEAGTGKTLLTKMVSDHFGPRLCAATINHAVTSADDLLAAVCSEFGLALPADAGAAASIRALRDFLLAQYAHDTPAVLVIDEAQALPREGFEQLRTFGNLEENNAKLLPTLIVGQPELCRMFQAPHLRRLRQRIFRTFHLPVLNRAQCQQYIQHRLDIVGAQAATVFEPAAIAVIHRHSQGLPRLINTLCDNAMLSAYAADTQTVSGDMVESVIAQMLSIEQRQRVRPSGASFPPEERRTVCPPVGTYRAGRASERVQRVESRFESMAARIGRLDRRIGRQTVRVEQASTACVEKGTDRLSRRAPDRAASSEVCDQQLRRLTAIVRRLAGDVKGERAGTESPTGPKSLIANAAPSADGADQSSASIQPMVRASERLRELVHQSRTSIDALRSLMAGADVPASDRAATEPTGAGPRLASPVTSLAREVEHLSRLSDILGGEPPTHP